jgi:hypothetical protein
VRILVDLGSYIRLILVLCVLPAELRAAEFSLESFRDSDGSNTPVIIVQGDFEPGDHLVFQSHVTSLPRGSLIILSSEGGSLEAGLGMGRIIKAQGFDTMVADTCASACALAWLAGRVLYSYDTARIGFHLAYKGDNNFSESGAGNALVGLYLGELGLGENVVRYVTSAQPDGMQWLSIRDAQLLGIAVHIFEDKDTAVSKAPPEPTDATIPGIDQANASRAVKNAIQQYQEHGMWGLEDSSRACWRVVDKKRSADAVQYCHILDLVGIMISDAAFESRGIAKSEHFADDARVTDLANGMYESGISVEIAPKLKELWAEQFRTAIAEATR